MWVRAGMMTRMCGYMQGTAGTSNGRYQRFAGACRYASPRVTVRCLGFVGTCRSQEHCGCMQTQVGSSGYMQERRSQAVSIAVRCLGFVGTCREEARTMWVHAGRIMKPAAVTVRWVHAGSISSIAHIVLGFVGTCRSATTGACRSCAGR